MTKYKGRKGYVGLLKRVDMVFILASALIAALVYYIGLKLWGSRANIATVVAVLTLLPACKRLANLIVILPFKNIKSTDHERILPKVKEGWFTMTDMLFSTEQHVCKLDHVVLSGNKMFAYSQMKSERIKYAEDYFNTAFSKRQLGIKCRIYSDLNEYVSLLDKLGSEGFENEKAEDYITSLMI